MRERSAHAGAGADSHGHRRPVIGYRKCDRRPREDRIRELPGWIHRVRESRVNARERGVTGRLSAILGARRVLK